MPVIGPPQARVAIYDHTGALQQLDVSGDFAGGVISYTDTPYGCAGADLTLGLNYETVIARGYWSARNIVEISSGDDVLRQAVTTNLATNSDSLSGWVNTNGAFATGGPGGAADFEVTGTGAAQANTYAASPTLTVTPGTTYTLSAWVDATKITAGNAVLAIDDPTLGVTQYVAVNIPGGSSGRFYTAPWTCPGGVTQIKLVLQVNGATITSGQKVSFSQPMLEPKSSASAWYVPSGSSTRLYVIDTRGYDTAAGHDTMQVGIFDGSTYTGRIPVTAVGTDVASGVAYLTCSAPLAGGGNPTSIAAYAAGSTLYRRRYAGLLHQPRELPNQKRPRCVVHCVGLSQRISEAVTTFALTNGATDIGTAMYALLAAFAGRWPELTIAAGNFPATGQTSFNGSYDRTQVSRVIGDLLKATNSNGDIWVLRVGHDRTPRLVKLFTSSGSTYTYGVTLQQGVTYFEPRNFVNADQDATQLYNTIEVVGDTNPATGQPVTAIVQDSTSVGLYGQIDAPPVTNTACKTVAQCAQHGQALLDQQAAARQSARFDISTRNDVTVSGAPMGLSRGDVVLGVHCVTVSSFEGSAPNVSGLVASVKTTLQSGGDMLQQVQYAAVKAPWDADIAERANALATALLKNTATAIAINASCVSAEAFPTSGIPTSGLTVNYPAFLALFAQGTPVTAIAAGSFTVTASATNWAWLNSNSTWTVKQDSSVVSGAILYAIFTTSTSAVIGIIQKAPVGVVKIGVGNINFGNHPTPTVSPAVTLAAGYSDTSVHAQVLVPALTVTNVPTDGSVTGLAYYYRLHGATSDAAIKPVGELAVSATGGASQSIGPFGFEVGAGQVIDVLVGFVGIGSADYGPTAQIGSSTQITNGFTPAALVVVTPYLANGASVAAPTVTGPSGTGSPTFSVVNSANGISGGVAIAWECTNQPTDGSLHELTLYRRVTGSGSAFEKYVDIPAIAGASASYSYTALDLTNGQGYDWEVAYRSTQGNPSPVAGLGSSASAQVVIGAVSLAGMPNTATPPAPSGIGTFSAVSPGMPSTDVALSTLTLDTNGTTANNWLETIQLVTSPDGVNNWQSAGEVSIGSAVAPNGFTYAPVTFHGLPAATLLHYGIRYKDHKGQFSAIYDVGTFTTPRVGTTALAAYSGGAPNVTVVTPVAGRVLGKGVSASLRINFSTTDFTAQPTNIREIHIVTRANQSSDTLASADFLLDWSTVTFGSPSTFYRTVRCHSGDVIDVGVYYVGVDGKPSATTWCGSGYTDPDGSFFDPSDSTNTKIVHSRHSTAVQGVIDSSGYILSTEFPGGKIGSDGSISNIDGAMAHTQFAALSSGTPISAVGTFTIGSTATTGIGFRLVQYGSTSNWYYIRWYSGDGSFGIYATTNAGSSYAVVATQTVLGYTVGQQHTIRVSVVPGSPNTITAALDANAPILGTDSTVPMGGAQLVAFTAGNDGALRRLTFEAGAVPMINGSSFPFVANGTLQAAVTSGGVTYTASTGASSTGASTITLYWDGTNGSTQIQVHFPSQAVGVTTAVPTGNYSPGSTFNASTTYYFALRINTTTFAIGVRQQSGSTASNADHQWQNSDGYLPFAINLACATPAVNTSSGGSSPGGGGGGIQCPARHQPMLTARGIMPAGEIVVGDYMLGPDGAWKIVLGSESIPGNIVEVTISYGDESETFAVEETHLWKRPDKSWVDTLDLRIGTLLDGIDGKTYPVAALRWLGGGHFQKLRVEGCEMVMGRLVGHNIITN